jgi:uncharacterized protein YdhG (YjbR/CyaY superfamily)
MCERLPENRRQVNNSFTGSSLPDDPPPMMQKAPVTKMSSQSKSIKPGGVDEYIQTCPIDVHDALLEMRAAIRAVAPDAVETVSYFDMPGYSYEGYDYSGMFAWFSFKAPFVRLHVRPDAIARHALELKRYATTKAIVSFPTSGRIPKALIKKLVTSSMKSMMGIKK